jgi:N-acetylmuramic acid 6-phosphate etherase
LKKNLKKDSAIRKGKTQPAPKGRAVFDELSDLVTEETNPSAENLHRLSTAGLLRLINREDGTVADAISREIRYIARAVEMAVRTFRKKGRLFYIGAGTSGRLGVLDAAECPPTFGTDPEMIQGIIAGGYRTLVRSREGVEDDVVAAVADIRERKVKKGDLVIGITASRRTPYVLEGLREAKRRRAATVFICCNPRRDAPREFDLAICPVVGPEIIAGSSRMKAGTAQKMVLNMITTAAMIRTGRVYGNRMVDLQAGSEKLKERSKRVIMDVCHLNYESAERLIKDSGGSVKTAIVMHKTGLDKKAAEKRLKIAEGFVHKAIRLSGRNQD